MFAHKALMASVSESMKNIFRKIENKSIYRAIFLWQLTLSTAVFLRHKCQQLYVCDKVINNSDDKVLILQWNKCRFVFFIFCFYTFLFNLGK